MNRYSNNDGASGPSRRGNRWGDPLAEGGHDRPPAPAESSKNVTVSDEEALRALMAAAQHREHEKDNASRKRGRDTKDSSSSNQRNRSTTTSKNQGRQEQQLPENDSYYGPRGRDEQRPQRSSGPAIVEQGDSEKTETPKKEAEDEKKEPPIYKPNFGLSGALSKDAGSSASRVYKGVILKFQEPIEARAPNTQWRFYVFKGKEMIETLHISKQSAYLCGRHQDICDIYMAHPSLSSQHAVLQYRALPNENGRLSCQPYIMDLESTNGTFLNGVRIDAARYYQLKKGDVLTFGGSQREYVLLTENATALR
jgi:smad nuclear-interacting protein 1